MYKNTKIRIIIAAIMALIGGLFAYNFLKEANQKVLIVVAAIDIPSRTQIRQEHLRAVYINKDDKGLFFPHTISNTEEVIGAITKYDIKVNKPIQKTPEMLVYDEEMALALNYKGGVDNAYFIPEDKRVIAIEVDASGAVNYKLNRGDFVDLIFTSIDEGKGGYFSTILTEHIPIFDIEPMKSDAANSLEKKQKILLLATPEECIKIAVAKRNGIIDLMLNPLSGEIGNNEAIHLMEFSVKEPTPKSEMIKGLEEFIQQQDISEENKQGLLADLEKEKTKETIKRSIEAGDLSEEMKNELLKILDK